MLKDSRGYWFRDMDIMRGPFKTQADADKAAVEGGGPWVPIRDWRPA